MRLLTYPSLLQRSAMQNLSDLLGCSVLNEWSANLGFIYHPFRGKIHVEEIPVYVFLMHWCIYRGRCLLVFSKLAQNLNRPRAPIIGALPLISKAVKRSYSKCHPNYKLTKKVNSLKQWLHSLYERFAYVVSLNPVNFLRLNAVFFMMNKNLISGIRQ